MGYNSLAKSIRTEVGHVNESVNIIDGLSFESVWNGSAYKTLTSKFSDILDKIKIEINNINEYASALDKLQEYKDNKKNITNYKTKLSSYPTTSKYKNIRTKYSNYINDLQEKNNQLRKEINRIISSFSSVASETITFDLGKVTNGQIDYVIDAKALLNIYNSGRLTKLNNGDSLYRFVPEAQVLQMLNNIKSQYSGREAAVNSALLMLSLAAQNNIKLDYEHKGTLGVEPYVPTAQVASGVDCNPFASWVVDKGTTTGFQWRPVGSFKNVGRTQNNWNNAQPGDVFVNEGHVGIIIENNPANGTFICAEASGSNTGIILQTRTYSSMRAKNYQIRDMTNVYNGTENTNRSEFNQYVNWNTYRRQA